MSIVIHFRPKKNIYNIKNINNLEKITNIFFGSKRKMVNKAFAKIFNEYKLVAKKLKINLSARPSELSFEDYYRLVEYYEKFKCHVIPSESDIQHTDVYPHLKGINLQGKDGKIENSKLDLSRPDEES